MTNKRVRSVSFNKNDPKDIERLKLIGKKNYSKFIKQLLDEEIKRQSLVPTATTQTATPQPRQEILAPRPPRSVVPKQRGMQAKPKVFSPQENKMLRDIK